MMCMHLFIYGKLQGVRYRALLPRHVSWIAALFGVQFWISIEDDEGNASQERLFLAIDVSPSPAEAFEVYGQALNHSTRVCAGKE